MPTISSTIDKPRCNDAGVLRNAFMAPRAKGRLPHKSDIRARYRHKSTHSVGPSVIRRFASAQQ